MTSIGASRNRNPRILGDWASRTVKDAQGSLSASAPGGSAPPTSLGMTQDALQTDYRSILRLALPVSAGTFMQFLVVLTDNYFLSRTSDVALNGAGNAASSTSPSP